MGTSAPSNPERRRDARLAIGDDLVQRAASLAKQVSAEPPGERARLPEQTTLEDFKQDWLTAPILDLLREADKLAAVDIHDRSKVGRQARKRANNVVLRAERVAELVTFLGHLESEFVDIIRDAATHAVVTVDSLLRSMTSEDDADSAEAHGEYHTLRSIKIDEDKLLLERLPFATADDFELGPLADNELTGILFGVEFELNGRWYDIAAQLAQDFDLFELANKQVGYLDPPARRDPAYAEGHLRLALRLGASQFPILAHRAAFLTTMLLSRAAGVDRATTIEVVGGFYANEAPWIIESDSTYRPALVDFVENDNRAAVLKALRALSEGVLRPYGSLLVALHNIAAGQRDISASIEPTLGALADRFSPLGDPIFRLLRGFIKPELRNADAHLRAAVGGSGELIVRNDDGSTTPINPNDVYGATTGLRSALDGVDAAVNLYFAAEVAPTLDVGQDWPRFVSNEMLLLFAQMAAGEHTDGTVNAIDAHEGTLTVTYVGPIDRSFEPMLSHLYSAARHFQQIELVDEHGDRIATLVERPEEARD